MKEKTIVIFRRFCKGGDIIALFPGLAGNCTGTLCECYQHVGQHGNADYRSVLRATKPASPDEYAKLKQELEGAPFHYNLCVERRATRKMHRRRWDSAANRLLAANR